MGEHADDTLNDAIDCWSGPATYRHTHCRYCGSTVVHWRNTFHGWRLHDTNGQPHTCTEYVLRDMAPAPTTDGATG